MPYRRLPNTDSARLKALNIARNKSSDIPPFKLAFKQGTLRMIQELLPSYENALSEHKNSYYLQLEKSKDYHRAMRKAKMYISHFIQVINMSVQRGEMNRSVLCYFGLDDSDKKLPSLAAEEELLEWGDRLMEGEQKRRMQGLSPITNPTVAVVKVHCDKFRDAVNYQEHLKKRVQRAQEELAEKRKEADSVIQQLWNEVENTFKDLPEELKRTKASEYGINYVFRKNELQGINLLNISHVEIG
ncbi:MAG: hypothetical protein IH594_05860 [Bacteroidales bacterium]|nr:hypothetical protein [Bacteroidales bacterium]